jgi:hypothetical protein
MDQQVLRRLIRSKLNDGRLPVYGIPRVWVGRRADKCVGCDHAITMEQVAMAGIALGEGGGIPIILHVACFQVWEAERRSLRGRDA